MLVYSEERPTFDSNRLHYFEEHYKPSQEIVDFKAATTFDELIETLNELAEDNLHLTGTRGYVYHSASMAQVVASIKHQHTIDPSHQITYWNFLTRTGGLRETAIKLYNQI